jgi:hypothetical protein
MRQVLVRRFLLCLGSAFVLCHLSGGSWLRAEEKLKPEELVAKHLEALGTPEARAAVKTRVMSGESRVTFLQGRTGYLEGAAQFASDPTRTSLRLRYGHPDYGSEQLIWDGKELLVGDVSPGARSVLGSFVYDYGSALLKEGVLGGVTNVGWALSSGRKLRLNYRGLKDLQGKKVHVLRYQAKGSDIRIDLGFDPQTYQHVVTEYSLSIPASIAASEATPGQREVYWRAAEEFDDFRAVDGVTLPHAYKLRVTYDGKMTIVAEWKAQFSEIKHNLDLGADVFKLR